MKTFLDDRSVVAVGGIIRFANGCEVVNGRVVRVGLSKRLLPIFQVGEYFRAFLCGRMAWQGINGLLIGVLYSVSAVLLEELSFRRYPNSVDLAVLLSMGVNENFGYRQMTA